jgi:hypothetical protein
MSQEKFRGVYDFAHEDTGHRLTVRVSGSYPEGTPMVDVADDLAEKAHEKLCKARTDGARYEWVDGQEESVP